MKLFLVIIIMRFQTANSLNKSKFKFSAEKNTTYSSGVPTAIVNHVSRVGCVAVCAANKECCTTSYNVDTTECQLDLSGECEPDTKHADGWTILNNHDYVGTYPRTPTCSSGWTFNQEFERCYKVFGNKANWIEASKFCLSQESILVELQDIAEWEVVYELLLKSTDHNKGSFFIRSKGQDKDWVNFWERTGKIYKWTSSSNEIESSLFYSGEPNGKKGDSMCVVMTESYGYKLDDDRCYMTFQYICEKDVKYA